MPIKNRAQIRNPVTEKWVKINTEFGGIVGHKSDKKPYANIPTIDEYRATHHPTTEELEKIPVFFTETVNKYARNKIVCNCGHYAREHFLKEGQCRRCGCTWYYPNDKWIISQRRKAYQLKVEESTNAQ